MENEKNSKLGDISKYDKDLQNVLVSSAVEGNVPSNKMQKYLQDMADGKITEQELIEKLNFKYKEK